VEAYSVIGKPAHDARIVALMLAHGVTQLLTLNPSDFARYQGITTVTPQEILSQA
jgi:predicted nucleic acid-binding protein